MIIKDSTYIRGFLKIGGVVFLPIELFNNTRFGKFLLKWNRLFPFMAGLLFYVAAPAGEYDAPEVQWTIGMLFLIQWLWYARKTRLDDVDKAVQEVIEG